MSPLLNYRTQVPAAKTVGEIMGMLAARGARTILTEYDDQGAIIGLSFEIPHGQMVLQFKVPVHPDKVLAVLNREKMRNYRLRRTFTREQAVMIAWRIAKHWVESQIALLEMEMVELEQIFLPYLVTNSGRTLYEVMANSRFLLPEGRTGNEVRS